jgi:hypothetical protein
MPTEKLLNVTDPRRKPYKRVIKTRPVTFACAECKREVTEDLYPGAAPRYCMGCLQEVHRRKNAERQKAWRERQRA